MNIKEIEKQINKKTIELVTILAELNKLEEEKENYYNKQRAWCRKIKNIIKGNENHIPFID